MNDFAAAAMLRLIGLGLKRQGIAWPAPAPAAARGAHVPLGDKRRLLDALLQQHGAEALLRIGEGVRDASDEPALVALTLARDPADLVARWQRLERFIHSRHACASRRPARVACSCGMCRWWLARRPRWPRTCWSSGCWWR